MFLALVEGEHPDELRADFQQYYGLNIDRMGYLDGFSHAHAAVLAAQLPSTSRVFTAYDPNNAWDEQTAFLAHIEYNLRVLIWQKSKDGAKNRNPPKPPQTPKERAQALARRANVDKQLVDKVLGMGGEFG